ncbi:MAG TPA: hypothetical protein VH558_01580 [Pseudolabrys sp.]|jgi:hypothetical protein
MTTFYDYDVLYGNSRMELYVLRANRSALPAGRCSIWRDRNHHWVRVTCTRSKYGKRYRRYATLNEAMTSGIAWARRREAQERSQERQAA